MRAGMPPPLMAQRTLAPGIRVPLPPRGPMVRGGLPGQVPFGQLPFPPRNFQPGMRPPFPQGNMPPNIQNRMALLPTPGGPLSVPPPQPGLQMAQPHPPPAGQDPPMIDGNGDLWLENKSPEGKVYYYNARTRETSWEKPKNLINKPLNPLQQQQLFQHQMQQQQQHMQQQAQQHQMRHQQQIQQQQQHQQTHQQQEPQPQHDQQSGSTTTQEEQTPHQTQQQGQEPQQAQQQSSHSSESQHQELQGEQDKNKLVAGNNHMAGMLQATQPSSQQPPSSATNTAEGEGPPKTPASVQGPESGSSGPGAGMGGPPLGLGPPAGQSQGPNSGQGVAPASNQGVGLLPGQGHVPGAHPVPRVLGAGPGPTVRPAGLLPGGPGLMPGPQHLGSLLGMPGMPRPGMPRPAMLGPGGMPPHAPPDMGIPAGMLPRMPPPGMLPPGLPMPPPMGVRPPHSPWSKHKTPDGREYYYNLQTMQSTWEKPKDLGEEATEQAQGLPPGMPNPGILPPGFPGLPGAGGPAATMPGSADPPVDEKEKEEKESDEKKDGTSQEGEAKEEESSQDDETKQDKETENKEEVETPSKPVASQLIPGTSWCVVWTGDGKQFFFNPTTRLSIWEKPEELEDNDKVDDIVEKGPPSKQSKETKPRKSLSEEDDEDEGPAAKRQRSDSTKSEEDVEMKEPEIESAPAAEVERSRVEEKVRQERRAHEQRHMLTLDERMSQFREMMLERGVSAFSTWDKELPKIVFDPRFLLLTQRERKQCFERFVRTRADEERMERKVKLKERKNEFRSLLEEAKVTSKTTFSEFAMKHGKNDKFKGIEKMKERETLFIEYVAEMKKREKEGVKVKQEKTRSDFFELLSEHTLDAKSQWRKVRSKIEKDFRYKAIDNVGVREELFKEYMEQLLKSEDTDKEREREKKERVEASLREREREVRASQAELAKAREKEKEHHLREKAVQHFNALLADMVRNADVNWKETKRSLRKDHRWSMAEPLGKEDKEKLFNEHIKLLNAKKREQFRRLLDETPDVTLTSSWRSARKLIKEDPRYSKFSSSDRKREAEFNEYIHDKLSNAKADFKQLLKETHVITYKSKKQIEHSSRHMKEINQYLKNDRRSLVLESIPEERERLLMSYIEELYRRGPPPPPTASAPSNRSKH